MGYGEGWFEEEKEVVDDDFEERYDALFEDFSEPRCKFEDQNVLNKSKLSKYELDDFMCEE